MLIYPQLGFLKHTRWLQDDALNSRRVQCWTFSEMGAYSVPSFSILLCIHVFECLLIGETRDQTINQFGRNTTAVKNMAIFDEIF